MQKHQIAILAYLQEHSIEFVRWHESAKSAKSKLLITDLSQTAIQFIDETIKKELKMYGVHTIRHSFLTDLLIELHIHHSQEFLKELNKVASEAVAYSDPKPAA